MQPAGTGRMFEDNGFDSGGDCGDWNEDCGVDDCVVATAKGYANPSEYRLDWPNSNTFAGTVARACGLKPPPIVDTILTPGWNDAPAPPKKGKPLEPVRCHLP